MGSATRAFLAGLIDYAGLFPPAALPMDEAVRSYAEYRRGTEAWVLNRFVVSARRLGEFGEALSAMPAGLRGAGPWRVTAVAGGDLAADADSVRDFNGRLGGTVARVEAMEAVARTADEIGRARSAVPEDLGLVLELPLDGDLPALARAAKAAGARAKIRTGGVTAADFPPARSVLRFLDACAAERLSFKATAGLHHAVRGPAPLTYEAESAHATMFGYLNVVLAAVALWNGRSAGRVIQILEDEERDAFQPNGNLIVWRSLRFSEEDIAGARRDFITAIGSCSFTEPLAEFRQLGALLAGPS